MHERVSGFSPVRLGLFGMTIVLALAGCKPPVAMAPPPPPTVTVAPVEEQPLVEWDEFTGRTAPVAAVEIRPRVSGYIQEVKFQSGQIVKKGEVLFTIDPRWNQATYDGLQADSQRADVMLENAQREAVRAGRMLTNRAISTEESDARVARFQEAKSAALAAHAARDGAKLDLEYTQVRSPIDGRVSRAFLTEGNYVSGMAGSASLLTTVVSIAPVYVYADIDEDSLLRFNKLSAESEIETNTHGQVPIQLQLADETNFPHSGYIESFDNHVDSDTGSIVLRAVFPNKSGRIMPGLFARIRMPLSSRHMAMLVPESAIGTDQAQKYVLSLSPSNTVTYNAVQLGPDYEGQRVIRSGLVAGEKIIVNGMERVRPGMPVTPQPETPAADKGKMAQR